MTQATKATGTATGNGIGVMIKQCYDRTAGYAEKLVEDVPAERFCETPHATMNHPAFVYGHLALYPRKLAELLGEAEAVSEPPSTFAELFEAGVPCEAIAEKYPSKDEIMRVFVEGHRTAAGLVARTPDEVLLRENPNEERRSSFPTIGMACNFLLNNHVMLHMGQVSAWRRAVGLGSVM